MVHIRAGDPGYLCRLQPHILTHGKHQPAGKSGLSAASGTHNGNISVQRGSLSRMRVHAVQRLQNLCVHTRQSGEVGKYLPLLLAHAGRLCLIQNADSSLLRRLFAQNLIQGNRHGVLSDLAQRDRSGSSLLRRRFRIRDLQSLDVVRCSFRRFRCRNMVKDGVLNGSCQLLLRRQGSRLLFLTGLRAAAVLSLRFCRGRRCGCGICTFVFFRSHRHCCMFCLILITGRHRCGRSRFYLRFLKRDRSGRTEAVPIIFFVRAGRHFFCLFFCSLRLRLQAVFCRFLRLRLQADRCCSGFFCLLGLLRTFRTHPHGGFRASLNSSFQIGLCVSRIRGFHLAGIAVNINVRGLVFRLQIFDYMQRSGLLSGLRCGIFHRFCDVIRLLGKASENIPQAVNQAVLEVTRTGAEAFSGSKPVSFPVILLVNSFP